MDEWPRPSILPSQTDSDRHHHHRSVRPLGDTSGNAQIYAQDFRPGIENQVSVYDVPNVKVPAPVGGHYHFPSAPTLPSNDQNAANIARLNARRQRKEHSHGPRRRFNEVRPYLQCHKYTDYRARRRQDTGEDGKPVWDDPMEEAFQNALVAIKPMGRKKKSQHGKPNGRNELIAEWIFQETGETRSRKQVSSHIQVLNQLLKGIAEWDALVAVPPDDGPNSSSMEYFGNSIEQAVNSRRHFQQHGHGAPLQQYGIFGHESLDKHQVSKLSFEMWVSLPEKMEEALHNYTRLQSNRSTAEPTMLENIKNWRSMYPRLEEIINASTPSEQCDIIMLDASFQLMTDFPPKGSKLGISLELDFLDALSSNYKTLEALQVWEGSTTIYDRGRKVRDAWYDDCHSASTGKVKPFFESKYWATTFTDLTERRRKAEDLKSDAALEAANERSRSYLRHLTVIQEIYARPSRGPVVPRKRMAILLWKFSQAQPHWAVGITTWQRLIPPPDRIATNSPPPIQEMGLPPLAMDTVMDMAANATTFDNYDFMSHFDPQQAYASFGHDFDEELCQDGTMMPKHSPGTANQLAAMQASFAMDPGQDSSGQDLHSMHPYQFDLALQDSQYLSHHTGNQHADQATSSNLFEAHHHHESQITAGIPQDHHQHHEQSHMRAALGHESPSNSQHPLHRFDISTHKLLQAQLAQNDEDSDKINNMDDEALRQALVAASAMNDLGNQLHGTDHHQSNENGQQHSWTAPPTPLTRPHLQSHASFAGHTNHHSPEQRYIPLQATSHNMAGFNANRMVAVSSQPNAAAAEEHHYQSTDNTQTSNSYHLDNIQSQSRYEGDDFVDVVKDEVQSNMGGSFVVVSDSDLEQVSEHR